MKTFTPGNWDYFRNADGSYSVVSRYRDVDGNYSSVVVAEIHENFAHSEMYDAFGYVNDTEFTARLISCAPELCYLLGLSVGVLRAAGMYLKERKIDVGGLNALVDAADELLNKIERNSPLC